MKEQESFFEEENGLTGEGVNSKLKSGRDIPMSEEEEELNPKKEEKEITDIVRERKRRGINADEASAARSVWQALMGRELTSEEARTAVDRGVPLDRETGDAKEADEKIQKIIDDPNKFKNVINSIDSYSPEALAQTFSGDMAKMISVILGEGIVSPKKYADRLNEIIESKSPKMAADLKKIIEQLEEDVEIQKKKEAEEEKQRFPNENVVDISKKRAEKEWSEFFEKKKEKGITITREMEIAAERAITEGKSPYELSGGSADDNFSKFDWESYTNNTLRELGLGIYEKGSASKMSRRDIDSIEGRIRREYSGGRIPKEEYERFRGELDPMIERAEATQEQNMGGRPQRREARGNVASNENVDNLVRGASEFADRIPDNMNPEDFRGFKSQTYVGEVLLAAFHLKSSNEEHRTAFGRQVASLEYASSPAQFRDGVRALVNQINSYQNNEEVEPPPQDMDDVERRAGKKGLRINKGIFQQGVEEGWFSADLLRSEPQNVVDLAKWIMVTDDARIWGPHAEYPLFKIVREAVPKRNSRGEIMRHPQTNAPEFEVPAEIEFQPDSLIIWLRNKMLELHSDNSTDPVNFLGQVAIRTLYSPVSILAMKYDKQRYFSHPDTGEIMDDLYDEVILEGWLFGVRRNNDLVYRFVMTKDDALFDKIVEINSKNEHTSGANAAQYYSMSDKFVMGLDDDNNPKEKDTKVGDGILLANAIYRNLADFEYLNGKVVPEENALFTRKGWEDAIRILNEKPAWEEVTSYGNLYFEKNGEVFSLDPKTKEKKIIFDKNGNINKGGFIDYLNFFVSPTSLQSNIRVVRELVKSAVAQELGFDTGIKIPPDPETMAKEKDEATSEGKHYSIRQRRDMRRINLNFVEVNSFVEQRWNGAAARNDTGYRGYDAWTKMFAQKYRERQSTKDTMGPIGNPQDIPILKMLAPDMWLAIKTENNETAQEVFMQILTVLPKLYNEATSVEEKKQLQALRNEIISNLKFPDGAQLDWASNQVVRGANVWHSMLGTEDLGFNKLVTRDAWGALKYARGEFEKVVKDEFIKNRRYAFRSNNALNYGAMVRMFTGEKNKDTGEPVFREVTVAEYMFGHDVIEPLFEEWYKGKLKYQRWDQSKNDGNGELVSVTNKDGTLINDFLNSDEGRTKLFKNLCRAGLSAQLRAHRSFYGTGERWNTEMVLNFIDSLKTLQGYKEDPPGSGIEVPTGEGFLTKEDIDWILKRAGCERWKLARNEVGMTAIEFSKGIPEMMKAFFGGIVDIAA